jgi:indole-3-pyruvate monooxygenase
MTGEAIETAAVVVGAGPAGLAVGACLRRAGVPFEILESGDEVGLSWRRHYDRLHLHTHKALSALPFVPFPKGYPRYPSRAQVIEYLEAYAERFRLQPRFGQRVLSARRNGTSWEVSTQDSLYRAPRLVIATGHTREPFLPRWPGQERFRGAVLHSSEYRSGQPFKDRRVLVVGFGNSGGEIAVDLWEHGAQAGLSVRGPVNVIPRDLLGIPILAIGILQSKLPPWLADAMNAPILRLVFGDLTRFGLRKPRIGPISQIHRAAHIPLIDVGAIALIKKGILAVHPGIERFTEEGVVFTDGRAIPFDAVILATGFRPRVDSFLQGIPEALDEDGAPRASGCEAAAPGLYFCGFHVSPTGMLREIGREAKRISAAVARERPS